MPESLVPNPEGLAELRALLEARMTVFRHRVAKYARDECPKQTRRLANTITVDGERITAGGPTDVAAPGYTRKDGTEVPGKDYTYSVNYAAAVEFGHLIVAWGHDTGRFHPPDPYMRRGLQRAIEDIPAIFKGGASA